MPRGHVSRRAPWRAVVAAAFAVGGTLAAAPAGAQSQQSVLLTFSSLGGLDPSAGINYVDNCYVESGMRVSVLGFACAEPYALATYTPADPTGYTGSPALFDNMGFGVDFATVSGRSFSLASIDLAPILLGGLAPSPFSVTFLGMLMGGGTVSQTVTVPAGAMGLSSYALTGFADLASVTMTPSGPDFSVQFDNVSAHVTTPEPATVLLLGAGLVGLAATARRRRAAR